MAELMIIGLLAFSTAVLAKKLYCVRRDMDSFAEQLENRLDSLISGNEIQVTEQWRDSLWDKVQCRLLQIQNIWESQSQENQMERQKIEELVSDISHQTKTPMANIKICLEILEAGVAEPSQRAEFLMRLREQSDKLEFLMESMIKMSRLETGIIAIRKEAENLYETLGQAISAVVPKAKEKRISLFVSCEENFMLKHDKKWTGEAIFNILENAVKYTGDGGRVNIAVLRQEFFTRISIRDSGKGIEEEHIALIFKRFYREPEVHSAEGIGIGLYLARKIITMQNGYIEVKSEASKGSEFCIYLENG